MKMLFSNVWKADQPVSAYDCPCCRYKTLNGRGNYQICPICFWEDDGQDDQDADLVRGGPNYEWSLTAAREYFRLHGACRPEDIGKTRLPTDEEKDGQSA